MKRIEDLALVQATFRLEGEDVVRLSNGRVVAPGKPRSMVFVKWKKGGGQINMLYHRIKFALLHGYMPVTVDHRNVDPSDNEGRNLRPATQAEQTRNRRPLRAEPRGVYPIKAKGRLRYYAKVTHEGVQRYLGSFNCRTAARFAVERALRKWHGEFYNPCH